MQLEQILFSQGFGTRHECRGLIAQGRVTVRGQTQTDPWVDLDPEALIFTVDGKQWPYLSKAVIAMNKPAGYECSRKPVHHPSVLSLLPPPLRNRGVQPVGRLDEDTTGLLILTDDGVLLHRLTHPKKHVSKTYRVGVKHVMTESMLQKLLKGVLLDGESQPVAATHVQLIEERIFEMSITQGKYHQVKRMVAAVGNRVHSLHRVAFGKFSLPDTLPSSRWCFINKEDLL